MTTIIDLFHDFIYIYIYTGASKIYIYIYIYIYKINIYIYMYIYINTGKMIGCSVSGFSVKSLSQIRPESSCRLKREQL